MSIHVEKRQLVIPGDILAEKDFVAGENTYSDGKKLCSSVIGLTEAEGNRISVIPLKGCYMPLVGDLVIGKVIDVGLSGWTLNINSPYPGVLFASEVFGRSFDPKKDELTQAFDVGDMALAKVAAFERTRDPMLSIRDVGLGRITRGRITEITPSKIPRLIGKKGSMISMLKRETECNITVAQNGIVLISCKNPKDEDLVISAIRKVEAEAHLTGLTDRVSEMIRKEKGTTLQAPKGENDVSGKVS
ncbi:MAG TPA: exosome complex RNA-binding protein Rrp4 [Candidatus Bathyarchaeia archaeon]|nr:MAG: hypothetical protein A3K70_04440 [Candidatus Bathyarchaeota archaeon RBG_16_48_13]HJX23158.1 exosome complex RNA-binding protein Rrp4 [Candidatus Bathyarchaeia archaeon]